MTPEEFVAKWKGNEQKESASAKPHFLDICRLIDHKPPKEYDPDGKCFSFEHPAIKPDKSKGFADVYYCEKFVWEYKSPHKNLDNAYTQLQLYRESLHNPPLLITSDTQEIIIHTNFTGYPTVPHRITFERILKEDGVEKLRWAFFTPEKFIPEKTRQYITQATADTLLDIADQMSDHRRLLDQETYSDEQLAHFLVQLLFALFAEDMKLLPDELFVKIAKARDGNYTNLQPILRNLFVEMKTGGFFWPVGYSSF